MTAGFDPEAYAVVGFWDMIIDRKRFRAESKDMQWADDLPYGDRCSHCGANLRYSVVLRHESGEHITVGETCLGDRFAGSAAEFAKVREMGKDAVDGIEKALLRMDASSRAEMYDAADLGPLRNRIEKKALQRDHMFAEHPITAAVTYPEMFDADEERLGELARSLNRYLDTSTVLTERQIEYFESLYAGSLDSKRAAVADRARKAEAAAMGFGAPRGKGVEVTGFVSSIKSEPNPFDPAGGTVLKMRITMPGGAGAYMTVPATLAGKVGEGDQVRLTADFEAPKDDDPMFAYAKRPRKAVLVDEDD